MDAAWHRPYRVNHSTPHPEPSSSSCHQLSGEQETEVETEWVWDVWEQQCSERQIVPEPQGVHPSSSSCAVGTPALSILAGVYLGGSLDLPLCLSNGDTANQRQGQCLSLGSARGGT